MKTTREIFVENLRRCMEKSGKNVKALSDDLGIAYTTVLSWFKNEMFPRPERLDELAAYFGIPVSELLCDKDYIKDLRNAIEGVKRYAAELERHYEAVHRLLEKVEE